MLSVGGGGVLLFASVVCSGTFFGSFRLLSSAVNSLSLLGEISMVAPVFSDNWIIFGSLLPHLLKN